MSKRNRTFKISFSGKDQRRELCDRTQSNQLPPHVARAVEFARVEKEIKDRLKEARALYLYNKIMCGYGGCSPDRLSEVVNFLHQAVCRTLAVDFALLVCLTNPGEFEESPDELLVKINKIYSECDQAYVESAGLSESETILYGLLHREAERLAFRVSRFLALYDKDSNYSPPLFYLSYNGLRERCGGLISSNGSAEKIMMKLRSYKLIRLVKIGDGPDSGVPREERRGSEWKWIG